MWKRLCVVVLHLNKIIVLSELETMHAVKIILLLESMCLVDVKLVEVTERGSVVGLTLASRQVPPRGSFTPLLNRARGEEEMKK